MEKKIVLLSLAPERVLPEMKSLLEAAGGGREILFSSDPEEIEKYLDRIEIGMGDIPFLLIPRMPNFKWWQLWSAGADVLQKFPELKDLPFVLSTSSGIHGQQIAEHLFAMLLGWNRRLKEAFAAQERHKWLFVKDDKLSVLNGKTMLIMGYGNIGADIARIAGSFGLNIIGLRRNPQKAGGTEGLLVDDAVKLHSYLPEADYVVNILPSTPATLHCFGSAEFGKMKKSALYISMGRGATTDEAALINALRGNNISGALLDVAETEPLPGDSPLWDMDNVLITGHYAGCHPEYSRMAMTIALENLGRFNRGEPLKNLVDKQRGY